MNESQQMLAAVSATALDADTHHYKLLKSIVVVARAIFGAAASSILLLDEETNELSFEAVAREGEEVLLGRRLPADQGIAGWVVQSGQPMIVKDLNENAQFARETARATGYVPNSLMAVPLMDDYRSIGVLEVLDYSDEVISSLSALDLLALFAEQASLALNIVRRNRQVGAMVEGTAAADQYTELGDLTRALGQLDDTQLHVGRDVVSAISRFFSEAAHQKVG